MLTGGEPFEYGLIVDYCEYLNKSGYKVIIHTNAVNEKCLWYLKQFNNRNLIIDFHISSELFSEHQKILRTSKMPYEFISLCKKYNNYVRLKVVMTNLSMPFN